MEEHSIAIREKMDIVRPAVSVKEALASWNAFLELKAAILTNDDRQRIGDKTFTKKSGWRKIASFFNLTDTICDSHLEWEDGSVIYAEFTVRATAPNGRYSEGWGSCSASERKFTKPNHDIPATAQTRAKNRAISDLVGGGEVSAEEMSVAPLNPPERLKSAKKQGVKTKGDVTITQGQMDTLKTLLNCDALDLTARAMEKYDPNCSFGLTDISQIKSETAQAWIEELENENRDPDDQDPTQSYGSATG